MRRAITAVVLCCAAVLLVVGVISAQTTSDTVIITVPEAMSTVSGTVDVQGTVTTPGLTTYFLEIAPFVSDPATTTWVPVTLPATAPVTNGSLGLWNTVNTPDGAYALRLNVFATGGQVVYIQRPVRVANGGGVATTAPSGELPAAPTAVPDENAPVPRPNTVNLLPLPVGAHMDVMNPDHAVMLGDSGLTWMKFQVRYVVGDDSLFTVIQDRIDFAHRNGFYAFISIPGVKEELAAGGEQYLAQYADFVGRVALLGPDAIQIWNEQNIDREWPVGMISGAEYVALLRPAYISIKAADPQVKVITGAPAPTGFFGGCGQGGCDDDVYYAQMAQAGAAQFADCIGIHYNEGILPPSALGGDPRGEYPTRYLVPMIQRAAFPFRGTDIGFCFSELGYLTADGFGALPAPFAWAQNTSIDDHAEWLRDAIQIAADQQNARVDMLIIFNGNFDRFVDDDPQGGFAIIRPDGTCPACETIATLKQPTA
jgi:hypothetical protein